MIVKLNDVCDIIPGYAFNGKDFVKNGFPVIKITDINPPYVYKNSSSVDLSAYDEQKLEKFITTKNDFVIAMTGATIGKIGKVLNGIYYINQRVAKFVPIQNVNKKYIYYRLLTNEFNSFILNNVDSSSAQPNISSTSIGRYGFNLHSKEEQDSIVNTKCYSSLLFINSQIFASNSLSFLNNSLNSPFTFFISASTCSGVISLESSMPTYLPGTRE